MTRRLSIAVRSGVVLIAVLCMATVTATRLDGQQIPDSGRELPDSVSHDTARVVSARSDSTALPGPRMRPDFQRVEPTFAGSEASSSTAVARHTFTITTVVLVLAVIIIVLLVTD